jgi:hypothetical protein
MDQTAQRGIVAVVELRELHGMPQRKFTREIEKEVSTHRMETLVKVEVKLSDRDSVSDAGGHDCQYRDE